MALDEHEVKQVIVQAGGSLETLRALRDDPAQLSASLKALGFKTVGQRKRIELALAEAPQPAPKLSPPQYHTDIFGTKRGRCLQDEQCARFRPTIVPFNHCSGPALTAITCTACGMTAAEHEDLGTWSEGEPLMVDAAGRRYRKVDAVVMATAPVRCCI